MTVGQRMLDFMYRKLPNAPDDEEECKQFLLDMGVPGYREDVTVEALLRNVGLWKDSERRSKLADICAGTSFDRASTDELATDNEASVFSVSAVQWCILKDPCTGLYV